MNIDNDMKRFFLLELGILILGYLVVYHLW